MKKSNKTNRSRPRAVLDERAIMRRDYVRTVAILKRVDQFEEDALRTWRGRGTRRNRAARISAMARACTRECEAIQATYEIATYN